MVDIPRSGIATVGQIHAGTAKVFNMGADLSSLLSVGGAIDGGDILSQKMSIGGADSRVGVANGALNKVLGTPSGISGYGMCQIILCMGKGIQTNVF